MVCRPYTEVRGVLLSVSTVIVSQNIDVTLIKLKLLVSIYFDFRIVSF